MNEHRIMTKLKSSLLQYLIVTILLIGIFSCGSDDEQYSKEIRQPLTLTDSAIFESYFAWSTNIEYTKAFDYDTFAVSRNEINRDSTFLLHFLDSNYEKIKPYEDYEGTSRDLIESVNAIDINNDGQLDIIYQGSNGLPQNMVQIFMRIDDHFEKVFGGYQYISEVGFTDNKLTSFTLFDPGCCAETQIVNYYYSISYPDNKAKFKLEKSIGYLSFTEQVKHQFATTKNFSIIKNKSLLRSETYELIKHPVHQERSNILAIYKLGAKGKAIGYKKYADKEWIYVIMDDDNKFASCENEKFTQQPTYLKGWILKSDTDLK